MHKVRDLRTSFIEFFKARDHKIVPSSSLLPKDDPTLLFTTAGMVQFKPMFAGTVNLEYTRAASIQKCLRTSDLESVGRTKRHLTFFEMLGNFSFGDYFKKESIEYAWDYSTNVIGFPKERLWVSIFENDDEAFEIWNKHIGVPSHKIVRLGKKDNFWGPAGDTGACGPCSELYFDRGEEFGCGSKDCKPGCDCDRFLEYWNLVFNQFNQDENGVLHPLPRTGIDTGMGLERLATLVQGVDSVFETDELKSLIEFVSNASGKKYEGQNMIPIKVIVEHGRTLTFAMSDGIYPSNEGRGYVLRRILRRALRFSRILGLKEPFVYKIVDPIVAAMGDFYPEIKESVSNVKNVIESEEKRFLETIENGMDRLEEILKSAKKSGNVISGVDAFVLYDTFGFPFEMTEEMALEQGVSVDKQAFEAEMEKQRQRGKQSWKGTDLGLESAFDEIISIAGDSEFLGYDHDKAEAEILLLYKDGKRCQSLSEGESGLIVLNRTPFYGESGGQVGDKGEIKLGDSIFSVTDTKKHNKTIIHLGSVTKGSFKEGDKVLAEIDRINRNLIRANHSATHLLQAALRKVLGNHVKQAGSVVDAERLRFDFSHFNSLTDEEILEIEKLVNEKIWENIDVTTEIMNINDAVAKGAMAVFDEKYEDVVRVVSVPGFSMELCGGTHVKNTGNIGLFKILKESSPGAGVRRIEAVTLKGLLQRFNEQSQVLSQLTKSVNAPETVLVKKLEEIVSRSKAAEKEIERLKKSSVGSDIDSVIKAAQEVMGVKIISAKYDDLSIDDLRNLADSIRERAQSSAVFLASGSGGKVSLLYAATKKAVEKGIDCGKLIKETAPIVGGGGGGRPDMAQAGGKNVDAISKALEEAIKIAQSMIK
ncbi:MAG TPA: alanine--tRNA ligase [Spirochaetota bacterium]|nr:alanine--tRNA ligase [Spirochaetota bacterium]HRS63306.1 alanine--tRNA ligase [Spirochaetota bacterium]